MTVTDPFGPFEPGGTQVSKQAQGYQDTPGRYAIQGGREGYIDYPAAAARNADREIAP